MGNIRNLFNRVSYIVINLVSVMQEGGGWGNKSENEICLNTMIQLQKISMPLFHLCMFKLYLYDTQYKSFIVFKSKSLFFLSTDYVYICTNSIPKKYQNHNWVLFNLK